MIYIGVDLHLRFCFMAAVDASGRVVEEGRVGNDATSLRGYFQRWGEPVRVAVEACGFWPAFVGTVRPLVERVVLVNPQRVKAIASAKLKNDRVDARTLAHLLRTSLLPEAWTADETTQALRQQTRLRMSLGQDRTRWKNHVHAVLHQHGLRAPVQDLFGRRGRRWLATAALPPMAREVLTTCLEMVDQLEQKILVEEKKIVARAEGDADVRHLMTIPGIGPYSAMVLLSEIGNIRRFTNKRQLYSYAGLVPRVRDSADRQRRGGITRCGSPRLRWILVEAAHVAARCSPAARRYFERLRLRSES